MTRLPAWLSLASLVLLLAILAWYQYRWIGEVSRTERAQMRSALQTILDAFARDFDRELTRLALVFADVQTGRSEAELVRNLTTAREQWEAAAPDPRFLGGIWVARAEEAGGVALSRFDPDTARMTPTDWLPALAPARRRIASLAEGESFPRGDRVRVSFMRRWPIPLAPEIPALILPADELQGALERLEAYDAHRPILQSFLILQLDAGHLREVFLPTLARRYNLSGETSSYEIAVVDRAGDRIYATGAARSAEPHPADGRAQLFAFLPPQESQDLWRELGGAHLPPSPHVLRGAPELRGDVAFERSDDVGGPRPARIVVFAGARSVQPAPWQIVAFHRQGSLDAVVSQARTRNLLVVAVILLLFAASVGFLIASNRRAGRLSLQQMDFIAAMTHELRTPLATIRSLGENLAHGIVPGEDQARRYGAMIVRQEQRLARLVEGVLDYSGMGLAPSSPSLATVDAKAIIADAIEETQPMFAEADASLDTDFPAHSCPVRADPEALSRALQNLLSNAVKFGGPRPAVSLHLDCPEDDHEVRIAVSDRGPGIDADDLPHVFEPFFRSPAARVAKLPGNGLGLSVVRRVVTAHEGRVDVESRLGQGTTFTVHLPRAAEGNS